MKFWKKIFLYTVILNMILINGIGIVIIEKIHKSNLDRSIRGTIDNQKNIINSIYLNHDTSNRFEGEIGQWFNMILRNYIYTNQIDIKNIEIFNQDNKLIASLNNTEKTVNNKGILDTDGKKSIFVIETIDSKKILFVSSQFKLGNSNYKLILSSKIDFLYKEKIETYKTFIILDIIINILLIIGMIIISKHITKPIVELADVSVHISNGEYDKRARINNSKDEIGVLSKNFNLMVEALEAKIKELSQINDEKERFINNLTHEMKTPITSIRGYSDILLKGNLEEHIKVRCLENINSEIRRLDGLSIALVKLMLVKNDDTENSVVSIKECIYSISKVLSSKLEDKHIQIEVDILEFNIIADKQLIIILLSNILENAIKACNRNGKISITGKVYNDKIYTLCIKDNGVGIPKEDIEKIMEPFYMVDKSRGRKDNGLGLGLAICKEICIIYNICFKINSEVNRGTTVELTIDTECD